MVKFISADLCIDVLENLHASREWFIYHSLLSLLNTGLLAPFGQLSEYAPLLRVICQVCLALIERLAIPDEWEENQFTALTSNPTKVHDILLLQGESDQLHKEK